jgi:hypothetical protein
LNELIFEAASYILENTHDGDDLSSNDLGLVEYAANGMLSPRGEVVLIQLKYKIESGTYEADPVWFMGIENLTRGKGDDRSVFWRGVKVEHYDHDFWCSEGYMKRMKQDAEKLAKVCRYLEENSILVNFENVMAKYNKGAYAH